MFLLSLYVLVCLDFVNQLDKHESNQIQCL